MNEHYDVMAEESYGWWTMMIAVPKNPEMKAMLAPFADARGDNDQGVELQEFSKRLVVTVYCQLADDGADLADEDDDGDPLDFLVKLLAKIRTELLAGNTSFLTAVAEFYGGFDEDEDEDEEKSSDDRDESSATSFDDMSKAELQQECEKRGTRYRKSWTKAQLLKALVASGMPRCGTSPRRGVRPSCLVPPRPSSTSWKANEPSSRSPHLAPHPAVRLRARLGADSPSIAIRATCSNWIATASTSCSSWGTWNTSST